MSVKANRLNYVDNTLRLQLSFLDSVGKQSTIEHRPNDRKPSPINVENHNGVKQAFRRDIFLDLSNSRFGIQRRSAIEKLDESLNRLKDTYRKIESPLSILSRHKKYMI